MPKKRRQRVAGRRRGGDARTSNWPAARSGFGSNLPWLEGRCDTRKRASSHLLPRPLMAATMPGGRCRRPGWLPLALSGPVAGGKRRRQHECSAHAAHGQGCTEIGRAAPIPRHASAPPGLRVLSHALAAQHTSQLDANVTYSRQTPNVQPCDLSSLCCVAGWTCVLSTDLWPLRCR